MKTKLITLLLSISFMLFSCGDTKEAKEQPKNTPKSERVVKKASSTDEEDTGVFETDDYKLFKKAEPYIETLKKQYDTVAYYFVIDTNYYFYVVNGKWQETEDHKEPNKGQFKIGLVDRFNNIIIPVEFDKIYNPNGTAENYIEVEKNNKRGLYHISGKNVAPAKYDYIYPAPVKKAIAQVKVGNRFGLLKADGSEVFSENPSENPKAFQSPYVSKVAEKWKFDVLGEVVHLQPAYNNFEEDDYDIIVGRRVVLTPSYILELGLAPYIVKRITISNNFFSATVKAEAKVDKVENWWGKFTAIFSKYYEEGISGRDYYVEKEGVYSVDENGVIKDKYEFSQKERNWGISTCENEELLIYANIKGDSLLEVKRYRSHHYVGKQEKKILPYDNYPYYLYFRLNNNGGLVKLNSNRRYGFTKYVKIDDSYFKGCFANIIEDENAGKLIRTEHLSLEEMELMKNEIFAEYGYIFTTPKWKDYFRKMSWYKPTSSDVNDKLNEVDKHNLEVIINTINKMKPNPDAFTKEKEANYWAAG